MSIAAWGVCVNCLTRIVCFGFCLGILQMGAFAQGLEASSPSPSSLGASAQKKEIPVPPQDEIRRVLDYYFYGKNSPPALVDFLPCLKVDVKKDSETYNQCIEIAKNSVPLNTRILLWTLWYLPLNSQYENVVLQVFWNDQLRSTEDYKLDTNGRFRTWKMVYLNKKGLWTFKILRDTQELGSQKLVVE